MGEREGVDTMENLHGNKELKTIEEVRAVYHVAKFKNSHFSLKKKKK